MIRNANQSTRSEHYRFVDEKSPKSTLCMGDVEEQELIFKAARNVLSNWVEALGLSEEEIRVLIERMVGRGEVTRQQGQQLLYEFKTARSGSKP